MHGTVILYLDRKTKKGIKKKKSTLITNITSRNSVVFFRLNSFVSCRNTSNKPNYIKFGGEEKILNNYQHFLSVLLLFQRKFACTKYMYQYSDHDFYHPFQLLIIVGRQ